LTLGRLFGDRDGRAAREADRHRRHAAFVDDFGERATRQRSEDAVLDSPERVPHVALGVLVAGVIVGRARGHGERTIDGLDDVGHRHQRGGPRELVAAARPLMRHQQASTHEALQHLGHQLGRDVVLLGDLASARRASVAVHREVLHGHQGVVGLLREAEHDRHIVLDGRGGGRKNGRTEEQKNRRTEEQKNRRTEEQRNRGTEEQKNRGTEERRKGDFLVQYSIFKTHCTT
jgi:hypothetical protein